MSGTVTVSVTVPTDAVDGASDVVTFMAASQADATVYATAALTTTAGMVRSFDVQPDETTLSGDVGETVTYTIRVINTGNVTDTYDIIPATSVWTTTYSVSSLTLGPGEEGILEVYVTIPTSSSAGHADTASFVVRSRSDTNLLRSLSLLTTTEKRFYIVYLPLAIR